MIEVFFLCNCFASMYWYSIVVCIHSIFDTKIFDLQQLIRKTLKILSFSLFLFVQSILVNVNSLMETPY